ncbi:MAG TPA: hypothetical protein VN428_02290 [Bryobacteraceae bacterium]|nr:hypothetical protein [Bryobacteraceae bacterium]
MTARVNILRALRHLGLDNAIADIVPAEDRIWARPVGDALLDHIQAHRWTKDPGDPSALHSGAVSSYREPGAVMPALQVCWLVDGRVEIDLDFAAPLGGDLASFVVHGAEVLWHWLRRTKTNQFRMAKALDKRFGKETTA